MLAKGWVMKIHQLKLAEVTQNFCPVGNSMGMQYKFTGSVLTVISKGGMIEKPAKAGDIFSIQSRGGGEPPMVERSKIPPGWAGKAWAKSLRRSNRAKSRQECREPYTTQNGSYTIRSIECPGWCVTSWDNPRCAGTLRQWWWDGKTPPSGGVLSFLTS